MEFGIKILGSSSAIPTGKRNLPSQVLTYNHKPFLIDCGEGTQLQLRRYGISFNKIEHVFISHLHGDHFFGLFGLLSTMSLLGRNKPVYIFGPKGIEEVIRYVFKKSGSNIQYQIIFHELSDAVFQQVCETKWLEISAFPLSHRKPTYGYLFREKAQSPNIKKECIQDYSIGVADIVKIKEGSDLILDTGKRILNKDLVHPIPSPRSFAYCSDTRFIPELYIPIHGVDLLYHEATFIEEDVDLAHHTGHSTAKEAAMAAKLVGAKKLIIGHFSSRYATHTPIEVEAQSVFEPVEGVFEGVYVEILKSY
jgi:ribonuclease Z